MTSRPDNSEKPLRLEWVEAGSLQENPKNWKLHSEEQIETLHDLINDPEIGWAGACLFNETTGHLIDGHARKKAVSPDTLVPVLIGRWYADVADEGRLSLSKRAV